MISLVVGVYLLVAFAGTTYSYTYDSDLENGWIVDDRGEKEVPVALLWLVWPLLMAMALLAGGILVVIGAVAAPLYLPFHYLPKKLASAKKTRDEQKKLAKARVVYE